MRPDEMNATLKSHHEEFKSQDLEHRREIDIILSATLDALRNAIEKNEIAEAEVELAKSALFGLEVGREIFRDALSSVFEHDEVLAQHLNAALLNILVRMFSAGGLFVTSKSLLEVFQKNFKVAQTKSALEKIAETKGPRRNLEDEAIRYALSKPLRRPLNKRIGPDAYAGRILDVANEWLRENGNPGSLTEGAIAKRLKNRAQDFPPPDKWPK